MKYLLSISIVLFTFCFASAQNTNPNYDPELAEKLGADDYGMKSYVFVILKTGPNESTNKTKRDSCFVGHMANIRRLVKEEKLIVAGPMMKNEKSYRGIYIFDIPMEEATEILMTDPAISAGYLDSEIYGWYGSAAMATYLEASEKIWKVKP